MRYLISILFCFCISTSFAQKELRYTAVLENGWWKVIDDKDNTLADSLAKQSEISFYPEISEGMFRFLKNGKAGFKNHKNKVVIPAVYDEHGPGFHNGCALVFKDGKRGIINKKGKLLTGTAGYDYISDVDSNGIIVLRKGNDLAVINSAGKFIVPFYYKAGAGFMSEPTFENGLLRVLVQPSDTIKDVYIHKYIGWKVGFINNKGKLVIDTIYPLHEILQRVDNTQPFSLHNRDNDSYRLYGEYYKFVNNRCVVSKNNKSYVINANGDSLYAVDGGQIENLKGYILAYNYERSYSIRNLNYIIDTNGNTILRQPYVGRGGSRGEEKYVPPPMRCESFHDGLFLFLVYGRTNWYYKIMDERGVFYKDSFSSVRSLSNGIFEVENQNSWNNSMFINVVGDTLPYFSSMTSCSEDCFIAGNGMQQKGYVNKKGEWIIAPQYEESRCFSESGLAAVKSKGLWGFIDHKGTLVIPCQFEYVYGFSNDLALVRRKGGKCGYIDKKGKMIIPEKYDSATLFFLKI